jgi:hypothetical protein
MAAGIADVNKLVYNITMKTFKHSGAAGDLIYSLPIVKHFGGGKMYLHLDQLDWVSSHYYGGQPDPFHKGRLRQSDFEFMETFLLAQNYISDFQVLDPSSTAITHNLDRFRVPFVGHPGNYVDIYASVFGLDTATSDQLRTSPWLTVPETQSVPNRSVVINRTARWVQPTPGVQWDIWKEQGIEDQSVFVGLPEEHRAFGQATGWNIPHQPTQTMLELAEYIAGAEQFIGNQSVALSIAIGLGKEFYCEARRDMPIDRNECYFPNQPNGHYF